MLRILFWLAIAQVIGWGTVGLPTVAGSTMSSDLNLPLATVFAGVSVFYIVMGLWAPILGPIFVNWGARRVMLGGTLIAVPGFLLLAHAHEPVAYFAAWIVLGTSGAASLSTGAYILLNEMLGRSAKQAIAALMLVTGLSSSIFLPLAASLINGFGWRGTCLVYAAVIVTACVPVYAVALRANAVVNPEKALPNSANTRPTTERSTFYLIAGAISLNAFVTFGLAAMLIEVLKAYGLSQTEAVALGATLGVVQVTARGLDFLGGGRWDGLATGIVATCFLLAGISLLAAMGSEHLGLAIFVVAYGLGSGAFAVARATIPLAFYDRETFAQASSRIALPLNLLSASAPPAMAALLTQFGAPSVLLLCIGCSMGAGGILLLLVRRRRSPTWEGS